MGIDPEMELNAQSWRVDLSASAGGVARPRRGREDQIDDSATTTSKWIGVRVPRDREPFR